MTADLKPCPFCGGDATVKNLGSYRAGVEIDCFVVSCRANCKAYKGYYEEEDAVKAWNTRSVTALPDGVMSAKLLMLKIDDMRHYAEAHKVRQDENIIQLIEQRDKQLLASVTGQQWQPIGSVPRDGKTFVLCTGPGLGEYLGGPQIEICRFDETECWNEGGTELSSAKPTHWMPLPAQPKQNEGGV